MSDEFDGTPLSFGFKKETRRELRAIRRRNKWQIKADKHNAKIAKIIDRREAREWDRAVKDAELIIRAEEIAERQARLEELKEKIKMKTEDPYERSRLMRENALIDRAVY